MIVKDALVKENNIFFIQKNHKTSFQKRDLRDGEYIFSELCLYIQ